MQLHQDLHQLPSGGARARIRPGLEALNQSINPLESALELRAHGCTPNIGEWCVSSVFPLPRYMWTPQGRHGSKLRTARMVSIPLNLSGPFSSKIGVFCTASSYGPGVP